MRLSLVIAVINKNSFATGASACLHIPPAIPQHETCRKIDIKFPGPGKQHAGLRLSAITGIAVVVIAGDEAVNRQVQRQAGIDRLNGILTSRASRDIGLVGHDDEEKSCLLQAPQTFGYSRKNLDFRDTGRGMRLPLPNNGAIYYPVAIKENSAPFGHDRHLTADSHLVSCALSFGCDTSKCQTTAWEASECGVIFSELTVGTITHASATCRV